MLRWKSVVHRSCREMRSESFAAAPSRYTGIDFPDGPAHAVPADTLLQWVDGDAALTQRANSSRTAATCLRDTASSSVEPCRRTAQPSPSSGS